MEKTKNDFLKNAYEIEIQRRNFLFGKLQFIITTGILVATGIGIYTEKIISGKLVFQPFFYNLKLLYKNATSTDCYTINCKIILISGIMIILLIQSIYWLIKCFYSSYDGLKPKETAYLPLTEKLDDDLKARKKYAEDYNLEKEDLYYNYFSYFYRKCAQTFNTNNEKLNTSSKNSYIYLNKSIIFATISFFIYLFLIK
ncbi:hypothetical protein [Fusobacterium sp. PH5-44]|uniref:hypothetical protein n=1 Tax=unclassified Fusobacterium TaxID=2648384 RepID=UPI003D2544B6